MDIKFRWKKSQFLSSLGKVGLTVCVFTVSHRECFIFSIYPTFILQRTGKIAWIIRGHFKNVFT